MAESPLASIPWACNEVGPDCDMQLQHGDIAGDSPTALPRDELLVTSLPPAGCTLVA